MKGKCIHRFQAAFHGLLICRFSKDRGLHIKRTKTTYCFPDDILFVGKGTEEDHKQSAFNCLKSLDEENLKINFIRFHLAELEIDWLGYRISHSVILPIESESSEILPLEAPKTPEKLRSSLGSVPYISKLFQILHKPQLEKLVKYDASRSELGAAFEQLTLDGWKTIAFTSRFLSFFNSKKRSTV